METIQSRYLNRAFEFQPATMQRSDGPVTIIPHNVLWDIVFNQLPEHKITCEYDPVTVTKEHCFIGCTLQDAAGRKVQEFGESVVASLHSDIAKNIPGTMAQIRAFDRAAIRYLDFACDGKVYSDQEIPSSEYAATPQTSGPVEQTVVEGKPAAPQPKPQKTAAAQTPAPAALPEFPTAPPQNPAPAPTVAKTKPARSRDAVKKAVLDAMGTYTEIIFVDTETSGLKPGEDRVLELAAEKYAIENGQLGAMLDDMSIYIKPPFAVSPEITELTAISNEMLADKPVEEDAFIDVFNFFGEKPPLVAAYNTPFDIGFIQAMYTRQEKTFAPQCKLDVLEMARSLVPDVDNHKLETVAAKHGLGGNGFHSATFDNVRTIELFRLFLAELTGTGKPVETTAPEKTKPTIKSITLYEKGAAVRRIYVNTTAGTLYFDLVKKAWVSKDANMDAIDMAYLEKEAWACAGAADQTAFEQFTGKWPAAAAA